MQASIIKDEKTIREIEVSLSWGEFEKYIEKAVLSLSSNLDLPGFRKGHAPRAMVEKFLGRDKVYGEAAEEAARATFSRAVNDAKNNEAGRSVGDWSDSLYVSPNFNISKLAQNNNFEYKITLIRPSLALPDNYKDIANEVVKKEKKEIEVTDKEIDDTLNWLKKQYANKEKVEGDTKLDDEFAKKVGEFSTLEDLKKSVREGILTEKKNKARDRIRISIIKNIADKSSKDIPDLIIQGEVSRMKDEFKQSISKMGLEYDDYLSKIGKGEEELKEGWKEQAKERVETALILNSIAQKENIEPSKEEIKEEAQKILNRFKGEDEANKNMDAGRLEIYARGILKNEKTLKFLEAL